MARTRLQQWQEELEKLSEKRERNINKYIIPIEIEMEKLRDKIEDATSTKV